MDQSGSRFPQRQAKVSNPRRRRWTWWQQTLFHLLIVGVCLNGFWLQALGAFLVWHGAIRLPSTVSIGPLIKEG